MCEYDIKVHLLHISLSACSTKKLKELRKANSEKEGEREEENEEELALQGKENSTTSSNSDLNSDMTTEERNTKNTINSMDSKGEVTKKEGEDLSSNELQRHSENVNKSKETPSASLEKEKELKNQKSQMVEGKSQLVANCKKRTGADSPSPSVGKYPRITHLGVLFTVHRIPTGCYAVTGLLYMFFQSPLRSVSAIKQSYS